MANTSDSVKANERESADFIFIARYSTIVSQLLKTALLRDNVLVTTRAKILFRKAKTSQCVFHA